MKKNKKIILISVLVLIFFGLLFLSLRTKPNILKTDDLKTNEISYKDEIPGQITVYDFMSKLQKGGKINFTEKNYIGMGELITAINGIQNNGNRSWIYYVNDKEAEVGVSNYKINNGDIISWKYEQTF